MYNTRTRLHLLAAYICLRKGFYTVESRGRRVVKPAPRAKEAGVSLSGAVQK
jgi:hypothetical protein